MNKPTAIMLSALALFCFSPALIYAVPDAFPGAEGAGRHATGGRGGDVYHVTNLNDSGAGSLRDGLTSASGPRTIVFEVSGNIHLTGNLSIGSNITIAGQTAPGDGITICDRQTSVSGNNVIIRYMRFRPGDTFCPGYEPDALGVVGASDVIIDHVSASWGIDEVLSTTHGSSNVTVQWCMITEALHNSCHHKGNHGYGSLISGGDFTFHHNLIAHNRSRNPRPGDGSPGTRLDWVNNIIYNPGDRFGYGDGTDDSPLIMNYIGNYGISGPNTRSTALYASNSSNGIYNHIYQSGNKLDTNKNGILDGVDTGWAAFSGPENQYAVPFDLGQVMIQTADESYTEVLAQVGASLVRDAVDLRVIDTVIHQNGDHIDSPAEVGGWPALNSLPAPADTDRDGISDTWETARDLNPGNASDRNHHDLHPEYTNLEVYLNSLVSDDNEAPAAPAGLTAETSDGTVVLDWNSNSESDLAGYYVYRSTTSGSDYERLSGALNQSEYTDDTADNGTTWFYVVTAVDSSSNESGHSNEAFATPVDMTFYRDTNEDKIIDLIDLSHFIAVWLETNCLLSTGWDVNNDCRVNANEFRWLGASWLLAQETLPYVLFRYAAVSCRTSLHDGSESEADENKSDSNKLSVRGDSKAAKSWIKFDIGDLDVSALVEAQLRITLLEPKTSTCKLSAVNNDYLDNIDWNENDLTWNNAPGNYTSSDGVNPDAPISTDALQEELDPAQTSFITTVDYSYGGDAGDQFFFDVLSILQADTDGIVQFVLHGAGGYTNFTTHDSSQGNEYRPVLVLTTTE